MRAQSAVPSKHAEHTHEELMCAMRVVRQELMHALIVRVMQELMRTLSLHIRN
jgi:hypothetical protein